MGILDEEYPTGYYDTPAAPQFTMGGGLLAEPADTGFSQVAPFGLLSGPAPAAAPARGGFSPFGGGGEPTDWRSLLMSAGAGLLKSNGRLEGLGDGIMSGMKMGQQNAGQRQMQQFRGLQMQKLQREMAESERLDAAWENMFKPLAPQPAPTAGGGMLPIVQATGEQFADVTAETPDGPKGFASNVSLSGGGSDAARVEFGGAAPRVEQPRAHPLLAGMAPEEIAMVRGLGRLRGEQYLLQRMNKEAADKFESVDPTTVGLPEGSVVQRNARSGKLDVISRGEAPRTITVNGRVHLQNRDGTPGQDIGAAGEDRIITLNGQPYLESELRAARDGNRPPQPTQQTQAPAAPAGPRREGYAGSYDIIMPQASPALSQATEMQESGGRPGLVSPKGAFGVRQIMPATWAETAKELGIADTPANRTSEDINRQVGDAYMNKMLQRYGGNVPMALAAYNAGPGSVDRWTRAFGDPRLGDISNAEWVARIPFKETREYVPGVLARMQGGAAPTQTAGQGATPVQTMPAPQRGGVQVAGNGPQPLMSVPLKEEPVAVTDPDTGKSVFVPKSQAIGREPARTPRDDKNFEHTKEVRQEYLAQSKPFIEARDGYNRMLASNRGKDQTGPDDMALIFSFMKMLDPGSVVREGEYANAANAGAASERLWAAYNKAVDGVLLTDDQRKNFLQQARSQYTGAVAQHADRMEMYRKIAQKRGFDPEEAAPDLGSAAAREQAKREIEDARKAEEAALVIAEDRAMRSAAREGQAATAPAPVAPGPGVSAPAGPSPTPVAGPAAAPPGMPAQRLPTGPMTGIAPYPGSPAGQLPSFSRPDDPALLALPPGTPFWGVRPDGTRVRKMTPGGGPL